jgi:hypothetical protein
VSSVVRGRDPVAAGFPAHRATGARQLPVASESVQARVQKLVMNSSEVACWPDFFAGIAVNRCSQIPHLRCGNGAQASLRGDVH